MASIESNPDPEHAPVYLALRSRLLGLTPAEVDMHPSPEHPHVWGVLMERHFPGAVVTQAALLDGTASLYFSTGGGILGSGNHPQVGAAARAMLTAAEACLDLTQPVKDCPLPAPGRVRFHLLTFAGLRTTEVDSGALENGSSPLSPLYQAGQALLTQVRLVNEKKSEKR